MPLARPARPTTDQVATISVKDGLVATWLPAYDEAFADVARGLGYTWAGAERRWQRTFQNGQGVPSAAVADRAAELGHRLLLAGYPVEFPDEDLQARALAGDFRPEIQRWVTAGRSQYDGWLSLSWRGRDRRLYGAARRLSGSRYDRDTSSVVVPADQYEQVLEFAEEHGFGIKDTAATLIAAARQRHQAATIVEANDLVSHTPAPHLPDLAGVLAAAAPAAEIEDLPIARPAEPRTETIICLALVTGDEAESPAALGVYYPESGDDKRFRKIAKRYGCYWHKPGDCWRRRLDGFTGDPVDRLAELGRLLLAAGYVVRFPDRNLLQAAIEGAFEPEQRRWVDVGRGDHAGWFRLWWRRAEDMYTRAQLLTGSRWDKATKSVVVPPEHVDEVLDFAQVHGFQLTPAAAALVQTARAQRDAALVVQVEEDGGPRPDARPDLDPATIQGVPAHHLDVPYFPHRFGLRTELLPHQVPAVEKLLPIHIGGLFMDMGTGKTRCAIDLAHSRQGRLDRVIWFCPVSLKETILEEILKHTDSPPGQICVFDDDTAIRNLPAGAIWYVVGIESMSASNRVALAANRVITPHSFVVVDESTYIKGHASKRTRRITHMAGRARYRAILTGTPLTQGVVDLYAQMRFLAPDILGYSSFYSFSRNHLEYHPDYPGMIVAAHNTDWLAAKIAPFVYQVTKEEAGLDLPAKLFDTRYFGLTDEQAEWYDRAKWEILTSVPDWELESYTIFRLFTALQQIASGFWNRDPNREDGELVEFPHRRLDTLTDVVASLPAEEKVIIWCKYRYSVHAIAACLRQEYGPDSVALYYGDLSPTERSAELARWRAEARFLVATQATGGHGLTLTEAAYAVFYENGFKYSERMQAEDRIHRIGQARRPTYVDLVARCGIDKRIQQALVEKGNVVQSFRRQVQAKKAAGREDLERLVDAL